MRRTAIVATLSLVALALAGSAFAGGFRIPEQGAAAMGLANAFVGQADDPTAVQFNPAGMVQLPGNQISLGGTYITVKSDYAHGTTTGKMKDTVAVPPNFFYTNHLGEGPWWLGLAITAPFGLGTEWDVPSFEYILTKTDLQMVKLNPAVAFKAGERFSTAIGIDYYQVLEAVFESATPLDLDGPGPGTTYAKADQHLSADGTAWGWNVGALYKATDSLSLGFCYRSGADIDLDGDVSITLGPVEAASGTGKTTLKLPPTAALGLSWKTSDRLRINFDLDWTGWSAYDELAITSTINPWPGTATRTSAKDYSDTTAIRLGAQYALNDAWVLRGGFLLDSTPVPEETFDGRLPDGDRWGVSLGAGWKSGPWSVDFAGMYVDVARYEVDNDIEDEPFSAYSPAPYTVIPGLIPGTPAQTVDGAYDGNITLLAVNVGYSF